MYFNNIISITKNILTVTTIFVSGIIITDLINNNYKTLRKKTLEFLENTIIISCSIATISTASFASIIAIKELLKELKL